MSLVPGALGAAVRDQGAAADESIAAVRVSGALSGLRHNSSTGSSRGLRFYPEKMMW